MNTLNNIFSKRYSLLRKKNLSRTIIILLAYSIILLSPISTKATTGTIFSPLHPAAPSSPDSPNSTSFEFISEYQFPEGHPPNAIVISQPYAYIAYGDARFEGWGLRILDLNDPVQPKLIGAYDIPHAPGTTGQVLNLRLADPYVYLAAGGDGMRIIDVSNPYSPVELSFYNPPSNGYVQDVEINNNTALVAAGDAGLRLVDVSNPAKPQELDFVDITPAEQVKVENDHIFVAQESNLWIYDRFSLAPVGSFSLGSIGFLMRLISDFEIHESLVYISWGNCFRTCSGGLWILDISDPTMPVQIGGYEDYAAFGSFTSMDNVIFVNTAKSYLSPINQYQVQALEISDTSSVSLSGKYPGEDDTAESLYDIKTANGLLYVTMWEGMLVILDYQHFPYDLYLPIITELE